MASRPRLGPRRTLRHYIHTLPVIGNWALWVFMTALIGSQFLGLFWNTTSRLTTAVYGRSPTTPPTPLTGFNDEPYADRAIVCLTEGGRTFMPTQLTKVLADAKLSSVVDTTGTSIDGFRVVTRAAESTLQPQTIEHYKRVCDRIEFTLTAIQDSCVAVGFNVTRDALRIVAGVDSNTTQEITRALPVLLVPFWDNAVHTAYVIPAHDGSACVFRLNGLYQSPTIAFGVFRVVPKAVRHAKTVEWLAQPNGVWRNGWYEARDGQRWYSNMMTSRNNGPFGLHVRQFDTLTNTELNCEVSEASSHCQSALVIDTWGRTLQTTTTLLQQDQVFVTNGSRFGLFLFQATSQSSTKNVYTLEMFISNTSVFILLLRWFVSLAAMLGSYYRGVAPWQTTGLGAISSSRTFNVLPLVLLPKLKLTLCAFFTVGCFFEGQQLAFASAWYIIYPGIVECMLYYYSLLNIVAKATYRRMSDALFGPTLLALCALHYFRGEIASYGLLGANQRLSTVILSDEVDALTLVDFVTTDAALRLNGNATTIFYLKIGLLALNLLPLLLWSENMTETRGAKGKAFATCAIERIIALRASNVGGLGRSPVYAKRTVVNEHLRLSSREASVPGHGAPSQRDLTPSHTAVVPFPIVAATPRPLDKTAPHVDHDHVVIGYEMSRLGYLVFGGRFLLSFDDWYILTSLAPLRVVEKLWNYRIVVFDVARDSDDGTYRVLSAPRLCRLDDPQLRMIPFYDVTVGAFQ